MILLSPYGVTGLNDASSVQGPPVAAPYSEQDDENTYRGTPAAFAIRPRWMAPSAFTEYVIRGFRSPTGSLEMAARLTTASRPTSSSEWTSRISAVRCS